MIKSNTLRAVFSLLVFTTICVFSTNSFAAYSPTLLRSIKKIAAKHDDVRIGLEVVSLKTGKSVASFNAKTPLNPASSLKVVTALAALDYLRPKFSFKTQVLTDGFVEDKVLKGNIYIVAGGDPTFVTEQMYLLVDEIAREGFSKINGDIIVDTSIFKLNKNENDTVFKENRAYNALISPLVFNFNTTTIYVKPSEKVGAPLKVYVDPDNSYVKIINKSKTSAGKFSLLLNKGKNSKHSELYAVNGTMPFSSNSKKFYKKIDKPRSYFTRVFKDFLEKKGITISGIERPGKAPTGARVLSTIPSRSLGFIVKDLFTFSNNLIAENILRTMGHKYDPDTNSLSSGLKVIKNYVKDTGVSSKQMTIVNGSGLSRKNRISAKALTKIMYKGINDFSIGPEFVNALCVSGTTGTLSTRLGGRLKEKIRAKTGSLRGVASLSGIYSGKSGKYAFTVIANSNKSQDVRYIIDKIMKRIGGTL